MIVAELGQLLLNSGNRRHRRSGYRVSRPVIGVVGRILLVIGVIVTEWVTPPIRASVPISAAVGECSWTDRQHSGKDQSDNLKSAHYSNPFSLTVGPLLLER